MSISQARKNIFDIAERVQTPGTAFTLTENGKPKAVIMSVEQFESWVETLEVMKDFPDLKKDIAEAERDFKNGNYKIYKTPEEIWGMYGTTGGAKQLNRNAISRHRQTKRRKGN